MVGTDIGNRYVPDIVAYPTGKAGSKSSTNGANTNALFNAQVGGVLGQNAVENNALETAWDILNIGIYFPTQQINKPKR